MLNEERAESGNADDYNGDAWFHELPEDFPHNVDLTGCGIVEAGDLGDDYHDDNGREA